MLGLSRAYAVSKHWPCISSIILRLPLDRERRLRLHQPLPFFDVLAHEQFVGRRPLDRAVFKRVDAPRDAETAVKNFSSAERTLRLQGAKDEARGRGLESGINQVSRDNEANVRFAPAANY